MTRTLYIDVDGVICPFAPAGADPWGSSWRYADAGLLPVAYAPELVDGLNALSGQRGVRCVWLTSWEELAAQYLCPAIGLEGAGWPCLTAAGAGSGPGWWKLRAVQDDLEATGPEAVAWVDDQLAYEAEAQAWARLLGRRLLALSPDPRRGITPAGLERLRSFLERPVF
ncbi:hypothetical protein Asphe3_17750 [Pseudarthrobacter phenanthrenivorans Sphe3]|uniref:Uncharacterized protein n=1 Tax=Pseudarthrobacter phenanthrenivorans (strain DSM 18606 / JCM 16027 / LMG 23796 / Sphe3) TaxID=930171 RepID=F0MB55_PSEPM|nr:HAD domain-containing protein [Pseudarthrobacter phenanthrenivorans]ADX72931.1 hypothetical protein Asphe3_17750 [Pseudarthrobacter phenanthrenivorans Sphe3]